MRATKYLTLADAVSRELELRRRHGIPEDVAQRLFSPFFSTKAEGLGIGLSLCRSIIESHQGRIKAENLYNAESITGCRFSFMLPVGTAGDPSKTSEIH